MLVGREYHDWLEKGSFFSLGDDQQIERVEEGYTYEDISSHLPSNHTRIGRVRG